MDCEAVHRALAAGELGHEHLVHLAGCPACRARQRTVGALGGLPLRVPPIPASPAPPRSRLRRRPYLAAGVGVALVVGTFFWLRTPVRPGVDVFAVVETASRLTQPRAALPEEEAVALLSAPGDDPLAVAELLIDALQGEGRP